MSITILIDDNCNQKEEIVMFTVLDNNVPYAHFNNRRAADDCLAYLGNPEGFCVCEVGHELVDTKVFNSLNEWLDDSIAEPV